MPMCTGVLYVHHCAWACWLLLVRACIHITTHFRLRKSTQACCPSWKSGTMSAGSTDRLMMCFSTGFLCWRDAL